MNLSKSLVVLAVYSLTSLEAMYNDSFHQKEGRQLTRDERYIHRILLQENEKSWFVFLPGKRHIIVGLVSTVLLC